MRKMPSGVTLDIIVTMIEQYGAQRALESFNRVGRTKPVKPQPKLTPVPAQPKEKRTYTKRAKPSDVDRVPL